MSVAAGRLSFTEDLAGAVAGAEAVFIAVGTSARRGGHADFSFVFAAAEEIAQVLEGHTIVVTKSTVPVGTNRKIAEIIRAAAPDAGFDMASNPEFLREGAALTIIPYLIGNGAKVRVVDPQGQHEGEALLPGVHWEDDPYSAAKDADSLVILTESNAFRALDLLRLAGAIRIPAMADLRNIYEQGRVMAADFRAYEIVGR